VCNGEGYKGNKGLLVEEDLKKKVSMAKVKKEKEVWFQES
jgi:hypothetical protein